MVSGSLDIWLHHILSYHLHGRSYFWAGRRVLRQVPTPRSIHVIYPVGLGSDSRFYVVTEYILYPKKSKRASSTASAKLPASPPAETIVPTITAVPGPSRSDTPDLSNSNGNDNGNTAEAKAGSKEGTSDLIKRATYRARQPRSDGGIVCSIAVNEYCFKMGRVTVPPVCPRFSFHTPDQRNT